MMNASRYKVLDMTLLNIVDSITPVSEPKMKEKVRGVRLEADPFRISTDSRRCSSVVSAHDLRQYKNHVYTIQLEEDYTSWLEGLLEIDRMEVTTWNCEV